MSQDMSSIPHETLINKLFSFLDLLWNDRKTILVIVGIVTALGVVVSLIITPTFKSSTVLLPENNNDKLSSLVGGMGNVASLLGVNLGEKSMSKLFPDILTSESVLKNIIYSHYKTLKFKDSVNLIQYWEINEKTPEQDYETLLQLFRKKILEIDLDTKTNILTISLETEEPQLSADILNNLTKELDKFINIHKVQNASAQRKWIELRLNEVKTDLAKSEDNLSQFQSKNRSIASSPQLLLEQQRLTREAEINTLLYGELRKQYELIRIEEAKNIPIIDVMDAAHPAASRNKPKRRTMVIGFFLAGLIVSFAYVLLPKIYEAQFAELKKVINLTSFGIKFKLKK